VPVAELHAELSRRAGGRYPRAQLAWDLARLRRERRLVSAGRLRIDLGVATGFATARKRSVLWVEDESGAGQYYQTFRMIDA